MGTNICVLGRDRPRDGHGDEGAVAQNNGLARTQAAAPVPTQLEISGDSPPSIPNVHQGESVCPENRQNKINFLALSDAVMADIPPGGEAVDHPNSTRDVSVPVSPQDDAFQPLALHHKSTAVNVCSISGKTTLLICSSSQCTVRWTPYLSIAP